MHNTLQLNRGVAAVNDTMVPVFSDIANYAGVAETDWSWSVLAADFNNDRYKDLHITNGMGRDMINSDFVAFRPRRWRAMTATKCCWNDCRLLEQCRCLTIFSAIIMIILLRMHPKRRASTKKRSAMAPLMPILIMMVTLTWW